jgi:hypothetical protein
MKMTLTLDMGDESQATETDEVRVTYDAETKILAIETLPDLEAKLLSLFVLDNNHPPAWTIDAFRVYMRSDLVRKCATFLLSAAESQAMDDGKRAVCDVSYDEVTRTLSELMSRAAQ